MKAKRSVSTPLLLLKALLILPVCVGFAFPQTPSDDLPQNRALQQTKKTLSGDRGPRVNPRFIPLGPGAVQPSGWLQDWAETAASGITGHLDQRTSTFKYGWTGQDFDAKGEDGKGLRWPLEQSAYWMDGLVRLAYILDDPELIQKAKSRLDPVVKGVNKQGGPSFVWWAEKKDIFEYEFNNWAQSHMGRALVAYYRATGDPEILDALVEAYTDYPIPEFKMDFHSSISGVTNVDPMLNTYLLSGNEAIRNRISPSSRPSGKQQADNGSEAAPLTERSSFQKIVDRWANGEMPTGHGVIYHENVRIPALTYLLTGNRTELNATERAIDWGLKHHGLPFGVVSSEEFLMGIGPNRGLENCNVAAGSWTHKWLLQITGNRRHADRIEKAVLNAGPNAMSRDGKLVCYFQTPNRIDGGLPSRHPKPGGHFDYSELGSKVLCCAGNANRIIPFYIQHMWMSTLDGGLAATLYGPGNVQSTVNDNLPVSIKTETQFPFRSDIRMTVNPNEPATFPLYFRIPGWTEKPVITVNGTSIDVQPGEDGFVCIERKWEQGDRLKLHFPKNVVMEHGKTTPVPSGDYDYFKNIKVADADRYGRPFSTLTYGPLLFALPIPDKGPNKSTKNTHWKYALDLTPGDVTDQVNVVQNSFPETFRWQMDTPLKIKVPARRVDWNPTKKTPLPEGPREGGKAETITLVPYGAAKFRISMFPILER